MRRATVICALALAWIPTTLEAGMILGGDLVVYRVGTGSGSLVNTGNPVFVDEYSTAGGLPIQSIPMPSSGSGAKLVASGTATSEGFLTVSPNGQFVAPTGYNSDTTGSVSLPGTAAATVNRSVAVIPVGTGVPGITSLSDYADKNNPRSAVTTDGNSIWVTGAAGGVRYTTAGSSTSTQLAPSSPQTLANFRQVNIIAGQLYASTNSNNGSNTSPLGTIGTGTPTTAGQAYTGLPGLPNVTGGGASSSEFSYFFADLDGTPGIDTLYVADDGSNATFAGLDKFSLISGVWTSDGKIGASTDAYRGLTGFVGSDGTVHLFATRRGGSGATGGGELVAIDDASGYNGTFAGAPTLLATAAANEAFRGVAYVPVTVPEPATLWLSLVGAGLACSMIRGRRAIRA